MKIRAFGVYLQIMDSETVPPSEATTKAAALPETTLSANMSDTEPVVLGKHRFNKEDLEQDEMAETSILLSISDDNDDDEPVVVTEKRSKQNRPRRSPNRDDSDSEDDDENSKTGKNNNSDDTESEFSFNIETDEEYHTSGFKVGFSEDRNKRFRRTMEDAHTINTTFIDEGGGILYLTTAFFAVFDGHAGRAAADFCGQRMQLILKDLITANPTKNISALLNETFLQIDTELAQKKGLHSGCTAAVAFTRFETRDGQKVRVLYTANVGDARTVLSYLL